MLCTLTGMDVANASMYDGASATAEATVMARDLTRRDQILLSAAVHPEYRQVVRTYTRHLGIEVVDLAHRDGTTPLDRVSDSLSERTAALVVQHPNFFGGLEEVQALAAAAHAAGALLIVSVADPVAYALLNPPGVLDADIVAGEGQPLGNPLNYGGGERGGRGPPPGLPGRGGPPRQTREQHIRRERATSNICTNEALNALAAAIYMAALGRRGMRQVAEVCARKAHYARERLRRIRGFAVAFPGPTFHEFVLRCPLPPEEINRRLLDAEILGGPPLGRFYRGR